MMVTGPREKARTKPSVAPTVAIDVLLDLH